ncbi:2OG-Fe dioxygenase family protein [Planosporangium sp. 12N6]|uniref:2OG-Fe dioxygenase family protein n=1 Tax=Planosporangium spinosum TaxID=3402278 RepID=UPI003CFAC1E0
MTLTGDRAYHVIDIPTPSPDVLAEFETLPFDPYTGGRQRYRRFSQYRLSFDRAADSWRMELLPHRPFLQPRRVNGLVGGVQRNFEPLRIDPTPQIVAGVAALDLDRDRDWQVNVHQCRVVTDPDIAGVSVPEGPHRDGHQYGMLAVFARHNIDGGENQLMPVGGGEPFFRVTLQPNQALVYSDGAMWHTATDIVARDGTGGHRDLWIVAFNDWENRKYGEEFERAAMAGDGTAAVPHGAA